MIKIFIKKIDYLFELKEGINSIEIENINLFRNFYFNLFDECIISSNDVDIAESKILKINNIFDININESKTIKYLYKDIEKKLNTLYKDEVSNLYNGISNLLEDISVEIGSQIEYGEEIVLEKLLQSMSVSFKTVDNFLINFLIYINENLKTFNFLFIVCFNIKDYFSKEEMKILDDELTKLGIILLSINSKSENSNVGFNCLYIDDDLCII